MTIRETTIAKLQQLPDSLLQEVSNFIDFLAYQHQSRATNNNTPGNASQAWESWFESVDRLDVSSTESLSKYQDLLLNKYRHQGLEL